MRGMGKKFPTGASSLRGLGVCLKLLGGTCRGEAERAAPLRDLLAQRESPPR